MRHLILMRHAEAGYATLSESDFDRPLSQAGLVEASRQGQYLQRINMVPDFVFCSPAKRTRMTWERLEGSMAGFLPIDFVLDQPESLYQASSDTLLKHVFAIPDRVDIALLIAHNPGIHETALTLAQTAGGLSPSDTALHLQDGFPPASMAIFECKIRHWAEVSHESVTLRHLVKAR